jgi:lysozyme family protein
MADFLKAFAELLIKEGAYVNDPDDPGGETKYGISKRSFPDEDIGKLTLDRAYELYLRDYWYPCHCHQMGNQAVANEVFEQAVHMGAKSAARILQRGVAAVGIKIEQDGAIGPQTLEAVNSYRHPDTLLKALNCEQYNYYADLVQRDPKRRKYMRGWLKRVSI